MYVSNPKKGYRVRPIVCTRDGKAVFTLGKLILSRHKEDIAMIRNRSEIAGKRLKGILLSLVVGISMIAQPMAAYAEVTSTVDNSVDKSTAEVVGQVMFTYSCSGNDDLYTTYGSGKVKVDYSNPENDYVKSLIADAKDRTERQAATAYDSSGIKGSSTMKPTVTNKYENSYDNRSYTWVKDDDSEGGILIGDPDSEAGTSGNQNRHMVIEGDYAREVKYIVTVEIYTDDHVWDEGVITKEATEEETGIKTFTCSECSKTKTEVIPKRTSQPVIIENPTVTVETPVYKGDITEDGATHYMSEFYELDKLPARTAVIVKSESGEEITLALEDLKNLSGVDPVDDSFTLSLPKGYVFANGSTRCVCPFRIIASKEHSPKEGTDSPSDDPDEQIKAMVSGMKLKLNGKKLASGKTAFYFGAQGTAQLKAIEDKGYTLEFKYYKAESSKKPNDPKCNTYMSTSKGKKKASNGYQMIPTKGKHNQFYSYSCQINIYNSAGIKVASVPRSRVTFGWARWTGPTV